MGKKSEQSKKVYNKMAREYDSSREGQYTRAHKAELIEKAAVKDGDVILDVACGNGYLLSELSKKAKVEAFGIDISEHMIAIARERYPDCTFTAQGCMPLNFADKSIDVITVSCAFHHFEDPRGFADECQRVLKAKGAVYMAEPYFPPAIRRIANAVVYRFSSGGDVKVYSAEELQGFFKTAGFSKIQSYIKDTVLFLTAEK